jgi:protein-tyrosine phosphatase
MPTRVLMVCMGNICRSPTAEGVLRRRAAERGATPAIEVDSAGTHAYHVGEPPDPRAVAHARRRGIEIGQLRARQVEALDYQRFDLMLAMDAGNLALLERRRPPDGRATLGLLLDYAPALGRREVPDPYYGGTEGFETVLDLVDAAALGLLDALAASR